MNIGILGTGSIARTMAAEFAKVPAFRCESVCSRQQATGEALAQQFGVMSIPTLIIFKNGEIVQKAVGLQDEASVEQLLK